MKSLSKQALLTACLLSLSSTVFANPEAMTNMAVSMMKQQGEFARMSSCTGKSEAKLEASIRKAMSHCFSTVDTQNDAALESCMQKNIEKYTGISKSQIEACQSPEEKQEQVFQNKLDELEAKIEKLRAEENSLLGLNSMTDKQQQRLEAIAEEIANIEDKAYAIEDEMMQASMSDSEKALMQFTASDEPMTPERQAELQKLQSSMMKDEAAKMEKQFGMLQEASKETVGLITLPIYENSEILTHMFNGMSAKGVTSLPAATFASSDSVEKVIAFYKKSLPSYSAKTVDGDMFVLMEKMPADFDVVKHFKEYVSTPHITISKADERAFGMPANAKTMIEIAYRKK